MSHIVPELYKKHWQIKDIYLEKENENVSWGFFIAGGIDKRIFKFDFTPIIVVHVRKTDLANTFTQLKMLDIILTANKVDFTNIKHKTAMKILKDSGTRLHLKIRRLSPPIMEEIELKHCDNLGISIVGGIGGKFWPSDHGIFVNSIQNVQSNTPLQIGDRLLEISSTKQSYDLRLVTFEMAQDCINLACQQSKIVRMTVGRTRSVKGKSNEKQPLLRSQSYVEALSNEISQRSQTDEFSNLPRNNVNTRRNYENQIYYINNNEKINLNSDSHDLQQNENVSCVERDSKKSDSLVKPMELIHQTNPTNEKIPSSFNDTSDRSNDCKTKNDHLVILQAKMEKKRCEESRMCQITRQQQNIATGNDC